MCHSLRAWSLCGRPSDPTQGSDRLHTNYTPVAVLMTRWAKETMQPDGHKEPESAHSEAPVAIHVEHKDEEEHDDRRPSLRVRLICGVVRLLVAIVAWAIILGVLLGVGWLIGVLDLAPPKPTIKCRQFCTPTVPDDCWTSCWVSRTNRGC